MEEIMRANFYALHYQIHLLDAETNDYPEWITGDENAVMNSSGVAVATVGDTLVEVVIYQGEDSIEGYEYITGMIDVGKKGLLIGNFVAASYQILPWPSGKTFVRVIANAPKDSATQIFFVLQPLD
jgi:hypothetical protein